MSDSLVVTKSGPFELLAQCEYGKYTTFCEKVATKSRSGYNLCDACAASTGLATLLTEKSWYDSAGRPSEYGRYIRESLERMGKEMAEKIGRLDLWNLYVEPE